MQTEHSSAVGSTDLLGFTGTPRSEAAWMESIDDSTGRVTPTEPIWDTMTTLERENARLRELLVECRGYLDRMGQEGIRERIDKVLLQPNAGSEPQREKGNYAN